MCHLIKIQERLLLLLLNYVKQNVKYGSNKCLEKIRNKFK